MSVVEKVALAPVIRGKRCNLRKKVESSLQCLSTQLNSLPFFSFMFVECQHVFDDFVYYDYLLV